MSKTNERKTHPIDNIVWLPASELVANDYNPNVVQPSELDLLKLSIERNGWIQPILITHEKVIIDGFHRSTLGRYYDWEVPCAILELSEPERMLLTIRINRAKGTHVAFKMAHIVKSLIQDYEFSKEYVAHAIGANEAEIELLLQEDVFTKLNIAEHKYSKAWVVKKKP